MGTLELKDIAIIVSGAITAISTLCAVLITSRFNLKQTKLNLETQEHQKNIERTISKIEDTYLLFEKWETNFSIMYLTYFRCYKNKLDYKSALELTKTSDILLPGEYQRLQMLMNIYFPNLVVEYRLVDEARRHIVPFFSDPNESKLTAKAFAIAQEHFEAVTKEFKRKISDLAETFR